MEIFNLILTSIYFMLPAYFSNIAPVIFRKVKFLDKPVDFNKKFLGKPILGSHKTWRGLFFGVLVGIATAYLQFVLYRFSFFSSISLIDYSSWLSIGFLLGFGALFGDGVKSFFKRRLNIKPGSKFIPFDQLDMVIGALLLVSIVYLPSLKLIITIFLVTFILHVIVKHIGYYLKMSKVKW